MRLSLVAAKILPSRGAIAVGIFSDQRADALKRLPSGMRKLAKAAISAKSFGGWMSTSVIHVPGKSQPGMVLFGLGKSSDWNMRRVRLVARAAARTALAQGWTGLAVDIEPMIGKLDANHVTQHVTEGLLMGGYEYHGLRKSPKHGWPEISRATLLAATVTPDMRAAVKTGRQIAEATNQARTLANMPGSHMTPTVLAQAARQVAKQHKLAITVLHRKQMEKLGLGAVLGVAKGSTEEPKFMVLEYYGTKKSVAPIALVGKGVTFDTGGINLKPSQGMADMHMDMAGGGAVLHAIGAMAALKLPVNVVAIIPSVENMPSGSSYRPGDLLKSLSGQIIEVGDTDAEGRVILADGIAYAKKFFNPSLIVDVATLTGAALVALGQRAMATFTNRTAMEEQSKRIGEASGDYAWPLPAWEEYDSEVRGNLGDWMNVGKGRWGGAIHGAVFLKQFANPTPWIHLDIAPTMTSIEGDQLAKGATGTGVRWLVEFVKQQVP